MARTGISYLDVENAVAQLKGQGRNPTIDHIRELIGTGSKSTIAQHLKKLKETEQIPGADALPAELTALVAGLWQRLNEATDKRLEAAVIAANEKVNAVQHAADLVKQQYSALETDHNTLLHTLKQEVATKESWLAQYQAEEKQHSQLKEKYISINEHLEASLAEKQRLHQLAIKFELINIKMTPAIYLINSHHK